MIEAFFNELKMNFPQRQNIQRQANSQLIIVGSKNPVKIEAAEQAFTQAMPQERWLAQGLDVPSGVSEQPMTDAETLQGAMTRMQNAQKLFPEADYWVGIEGGIDRQGSEMHAFAWIVVSDGRQVGKARTGTFVLPQAITDLIDQGVELGEADDRVFNRENSKQGSGAVGILTQGMIDRKAYYTHAAILALVPFLHDSLY